MNVTQPLVILLIALSIFTSSYSNAADEKPSEKAIKEASKETHKEKEKEKDSLDFLDNIDYPELQVVPKASERLETEAQFEREGGAWLNQWTFLLTGGATFVASTLTASAIPNPTADQSNIIQFGQFIGAATVGIGAYYAISMPYNSAYEKIKKIRVTNKRQALLRERLSEEALERSASNINSLASIAVTSNFFAAAILSAYGNQNSHMYSYAALIISSLSMLFPNPYITNWEKQKEYKHKIYTPLPQSSISKDPRTGELKTYLGLTWAI